MASTSGKIFTKAACRYCAEEMAVNSLARHEKGCENATPELRAQRKRARENSEHRRRALDAPVAPNRSHHKPAALNNTPRSRKLEYQREYQRQYAARRKANNGQPLRTLVAATKHARKTLAHSAQGNGFITFQVRVDRVHLLTLLAKMAQADNSLVNIDTDDLI